MPVPLTRDRWINTYDKLNETKSRLLFFESAELDWQVPYFSHFAFIRRALPIKNPRVYQLRLYLPRKVIGKFSETRSCQETCGTDFVGIGIDFKFYFCRYWAMWRQWTAAMFCWAFDWSVDKWSISHVLSFSSYPLQSFLKSTGGGRVFVASWIVYECTNLKFCMVCTGSFLNFNHISIL